MKLEQFGFLVKIKISKKKDLSKMIIIKCEIYVSKRLDLESSKTLLKVVSGFWFFAGGSTKHRIKNMFAQTSTVHKIFNCEYFYKNSTDSDIHAFFG